MRPKDLSEFSYGYALTEALIQDTPSPLKAAPWFPSLPRAERQAGGSDAPLPFSGYLLYLQFKLSDRMERRTAIETQLELLEPPFFRMHLRSSPKSDQHAMLIELERSGAEVFYATPKYNTAKALDESYLSRRVVHDSCFFRPSVIGPLPDEKAHWVSFPQKEPVAYFCSDAPQRLDASAMMDGRSFLDFLPLPETRTIDTEALRTTAEAMQEIILKELLYRPYRRRYPVKDFAEKTYEAVRRELLDQGLLEKQLDAFDEAAEVERRFQKLQQDRSPPEQVAYLARTFFGCEVIRIEKP